MHGIGREIFKSNFKSFEEKRLFFFAYVTPGFPMSLLKKYQPIWSSRLAGYREHINECVVLLDGLK